MSQDRPGPAHHLDPASSDTDDESSTSKSESDAGPRSMKRRLSGDGSPPPHKRSWHSMSSKELATGDDTSDDDDQTDHEQQQSSDPEDFSGYARPRKEVMFLDAKAAKMMEKWGYKEGVGLGKDPQKPTKLVELSKQRGRRGLGHKVDGFEPENLEWISEKEEITIEETPEWLQNHYEESFAISSDFMEVGKRKLILDDETQFCSHHILKKMLASKTLFDKLDGQELRKAVARANPFETIHGGIFLNRAAMKMANMDRVFDFMFTCPKDPNGKEVVGRNELLYFADVCAGPGGFSEYVLWRHKWKAKGFGFTLRNENDFKLGDFYAGPCESFEPHYGVKTGDDLGDGDIFNSKNQDEFSKFVLDNTDFQGVHFMMADGGFSVEGQENIQEILSKQLYLCQFLMALLIVRTGGHFVCKVFDLFTPFSVGLIYLMFRAFSQISIHKPNTSRPANSERYLICKWKRPDCDGITKYLYSVNSRLNQFGTGSDADVLSIVPLQIIKEDRKFFDYIFDSNNKLGRKQIISLEKVITYCKDTSLEEFKQGDLRKKCLEYWGVPLEARKAPQKLPPEEAFSNILNQSNERKKPLSSEVIFSSQETELTIVNLPTVFDSIYNWHCAVLGNSQKSENHLTFFLGTGRRSVFYLQNKRWNKLSGNVKVELSAGTLLLGEIVREIKGERLRQVKLQALHIVDAISLGGIDIRHLDITERVKQCQLFAKAMNKPSRVDLAPIHVKELFDLENIFDIHKRLKVRIMKNSKPQEVFELNRDDACFVPEGLIFFKATQDPWARHISSKKTHKYYYNKKTKQSLFETDRPKDSIKAFGESYAERAVSWWSNNKTISFITISDIMDFVSQSVS